MMSFAYTMSITIFFIPLWGKKCMKIMLKTCHNSEITQNIKQLCHSKAEEEITQRDNTQSCWKLEFLCREFPKMLCFYEIWSERLLQIWLINCEIFAQIAQHSLFWYEKFPCTNWQTLCHYDFWNRCYW